MGMGRIGQAILFLTPKEMAYLDILKRHKFDFAQMPIGHIWNQCDVDFEAYKAQKIKNKKMQKMMKRDKDLYNASEAKMFLGDGNSLSTFEDERQLSSRNVIIDQLYPRLIRFFVNV